VGSSEHFELTKLKRSFSRVKNVDVASSHLAAVEGHGNVIAHSYDSTSKGGEGGEYGQKEL